MDRGADSLPELAGGSYRQPAEWYDRIYGAMGKEYGSEAQVVDGIVRARRPGATSLLDVGCGTGLHLEHFAALYDRADGLDLDAGFVARARSRCPGSRVTQGDMRRFELGRSYDAVTCLFSAIAHVEHEEGLCAAIAAMAGHLAPRGVLVIEPWFTNEQWKDGTYGVQIAEAPDSTLVRAHRCGSDGQVSTVSFAWTEVTSSGVVRVDEELRLTRFEPDAFRRAFDAAGLDASFDERGLNSGGRGLWVATSR